MNSTTFNIKQGDLLPAIRATCLQADGTPLNLTGATGVTFRMWRRGAAVLKVANATATVVDATGGVVEYPWAGTDTDTIGLFNAEFVATFAGPKKQSVPTEGFMLVSVNDGGLPG